MIATDRILIVGADGMIGRALAARFAATGCEVIGTAMQPAPGMVALNLACDAALWTPPPVKIAFLCAAITSQEQCRKDPMAARAVNVEGTLAVAYKLVTQGSHVVFPSTNLVLSGLHAHQAAHDPFTPQTEYARQKAEAEQCLRKLPGTCVARFTKVLGRGAPLLRGWCEALKNGDVIRPFADMPMAPVTLDFAVEALTAVAAAKTEGIVQVSAKDDITYAAAAQFLANRLGAAEELVQPVTVAESGVAIEHIPRHTTLDASRLQREFGLAPPDVWDAIQLGMQGRSQQVSPSYKNPNNVVGSLRSAHPARNHGQH